MILIVGTIRLPPENFDAALPHMKDMVEGSRAEAGCIAYSYGRDVLDPGLIHISEAWKDRQSLDQHFASAHMATWRSHGKKIGLYDRNLTLYEAESRGAL